MAIALLTITLLLQQSGVRIDGVVLQGTTDKPVASAQVQIAGLKTTTDSQGRFTFSSVPTGRHTVLADKDGFMRARPEGRRTAGKGGIDIVIGSSPQPQPLVMRLFPAAVVTGRVYDSNGQPRRNVFVTPYRSTYDDEGTLALKPLPVNMSTYVATREAMSTIMVLGTEFRDPNAFNPTSNLTRARTNDLGEFRLFNLDPGQYAFYLDPISNDALPVYYPGVADPKDAALVDLKSGEEFRLNNVTLPSGSDAPLRVRIVNQSGETNSLKVVEVRRKGAREVLRAQSGAAEALELGKLPPGLYEVEAAVHIRGSFIAAGRADLVMAGADVELDVTVPPPAKLIGRVIQEPSQPVAGARISIRSEEVLRNLPLTVTTGADGTFSLRGLPAGTFRVNVLSGIPAASCLTSIRQGDRNVLRDGLQLQGSDVEMSITLGESQAAVKGSAVDSKGSKVPGAMIVLAPNDRTRSDLFTVIAADQNGDFEMRCLQPAAYHIYAWMDLNGAAYRNVDFMKKYEANGRSLSLMKGANLTLDVGVLVNEPER
jgi:hypothetical protein